MDKQELDSKGEEIAKALLIYLAGNVEYVNASMSNKMLKGVIEVEDTVDAFMRLSSGATGIFYATNAYGKNSDPQIELDFENASFRYMDKELYRDKKLICRDECEFSGKDYWGSGHRRLFYDIYVNHKGISPQFPFILSILL